MAFLAYDSDRVALLRRVLTDALTGLDAMSLTDPEAADTMRSIRLSRDALRSTWLPVVGDVLRCRALNNPNSVAGDLSDLRNAVAYEMAVHRGWNVVADPAVGSASTVTASDAAALGRRLSDGHLGDLLGSPDERQWLYRQLQLIAANPELTAAFLSTFANWAGLCNEVAAQLLRARHRVASDIQLDDTAATIGQLEGMFAALGAMYQSRPYTDDTPPYPAEIASMDPYAAAMFVSNLDLDAQTLAEAADDILRRWRDPMPNDPNYAERHWDDMVFNGANTADILFTLLLATPGACTAYVLLSADDPASMWISADDPSLAAQVAIVGTDPANISLEGAGVVLQAWLAYFISPQFSWMTDSIDGYPTGVQATLAEVVAPYLPQFAVTNGDWGDDERELEVRLAGLAYIIDDQSALDALIRRGTTAMEQLASQRAVGRDVKTATAIVADVFGVLTRLVVNAAVAHAEMMEQLCDFAWTVATIGSNWLGPAEGIIAGPVLDKTWEAIGDHVSALPNAERTEAEQMLAIELDFVAMASSIATEVWIHAGFCDDKPPQLDRSAKYRLRQFLQDMDSWLKVAMKQGPQKAAAATYIHDVVTALVARWSTGVTVAGRQ